MSLLQGDQIGLFGEVEPVSNIKERVEGDYYPTPEAITKALLKRVKISGYVFEPCCGQGAISEVLRSSRHVLSVKETDISQSRSDDLPIPRDATTLEFWDHWAWEIPPNWVVTNPPFSAAAEILERSWRYCSEGCAFLLRLSFLEPTGNRALMLDQMSDHLRCIIPVSPRPRFRRDTKGSDSVTCAWFVWDKQWSWQKDHGIDSPFQFVSGWR